MIHGVNKVWKKLAVFLSYKEMFIVLQKNWLEGLRVKILNSELIQQLKVLKSFLMYTMKKYFIYYFYLQHLLKCIGNGFF